MLPEILLRLDVALTVHLGAFHLLTIYFDVVPLLPVVQHLRERVVADAYALTHGARLLAREDFGKQVE